jgi:glycosyltransferase involved in cell wall biosynthesis
MKIAFIGTKGLPPRGGADRVVEALVRRLSAQHEITVYCSARYTPADLGAPGVHLVRIPCLAGKHSHMTSVDLLAAWHAVLMGDYDLVHMHNIEASFILPLLKLRYKVVSTAHGWPYLDEKWSRVARTMIRLTEKPFALLSDAATSVCSRYAEYFEEKHGRQLAVIPNGVESFPVADKKAAGAILEKLGLNRNAPFLLFAAGRIVPLKGCHLLLEAHRRLGLDIPVVIIGDLNQTREYREKLKAASNGHVHFHPLVPQPTLLGLLALARTFVFPSTREGMSMMLLEAASLGVPIISSGIPENREVLGPDAIYFESGSVEDLARAIRWGLDNTDVMVRIATETKRHLAWKLSWDRIAGQYERIYYEVANGGAWSSEREPELARDPILIENAPGLVMKLLSQRQPHSRSSLGAMRAPKEVEAEECLAGPSARDISAHAPHLGGADEKITLSDRFRRHR